MPFSSLSPDANALLALLPADGSRSGNISLRLNLGWNGTRYGAARIELLTVGHVSRGRGKGGSIAIK